MTAHSFVGPITRQLLTIHVNAGRVDVEHSGCDQPADVIPYLDSVYCSACGLNDRVSGAWVMDLIETEPTPQADKKKP